MKIKSFMNSVFFILFISFLQQPCLAQQTEHPVIKVAMSDDQSLIIGRLLYTALKNMGFQMTAKVSGMRTSIADVNYGDAAILPSQTEGWDIQYPNLIKVPVPIEYVEFTAFTRSNDVREFSAWSDMAGLRLCYRWQNQYVANNAPRAGASGFVIASDLDEVWEALINNKADVAVIPRITYTGFMIPREIRKAGVIERQACYSYVNRDFAYLAPLLEKTYRKMIDDGTMESIRNNRYPEGHRQNVLHISSYNMQIQRERSQVDGIREFLEKNTQAEYRNINLNSYEHRINTGFDSIISETIRAYYLERSPDLVIASDYEALKYVMDTYYILFPGLPVVFCGINEPDSLIMYGLGERLTGVTDTVSFFENVSEMLRLVPGTSRIFILNDYSLTRSAKMREIMEESIKFRNFSVEFVFSRNRSLPEILEEIRGFGPETLVLIGNYLTDSAGTHYTETEIQSQVAKASVNPVFSLSDSYIGSGTLGGMVSSVDAQSSVAAGMAVDILNGKAPSAIPAVMDSASLNRWQFDYGAAKKFRIDVKTLPQGHMIVNRSLRVWESNPIEFRLALVVAVLLVLIIVGLMVFTNELAKKQADAEGASVAKSSFLANMSHEIRTPMNAIIGMTSIGKSAPDIERKDYCLGRIDDASKHLLGIINDILDMSKIEAGKFELSFTEFNLEKMLQRVVNVNNIRILEKQQNFSVTIDSDIPKALISDEQRLAQVITNLIGNAVKFTPEKGSIKLTTRFLGEDNGACTIQFAVTDTGIGISQEQQNRLFQSFNQADNSTSRKFGGTGLGLSISKNIVEMMGGSIWIESELGSGASFIFTIKAKRGIEKTWLVPDLKNISILAIDDDQVVLEYFRKIIEGFGTTCEVASSGERALQLIAKKGAFNIYFVDWRMPGIDGMLLAETLKLRKSATFKSYVVLMSSAEMHEIEDEAKKVGVDRFLSKPLFPSSILDVINSLIGVQQIPEAASGENGAAQAAPPQGTEAADQKPREAPQANGHANTADQFEGRRILLAEDVDINREIVQALLEPTLIAIDCAEDGDDAVAMFSKAPDIYDMIFMDVQMPRMDGYTATRAIRALNVPKAKTIPIVAMTANVFREDVERCLAAGMNSHVGKPVNMVEVMEKLRTYLK